MSEWRVRDLDSGKEKEADSKADAQEKQRELEQLDMDVEIVPPESASTDGGTKAAKIESPDEDPIEDPTQPTAVVDEPDDAPQQSEVLSAEEVEEFAGELDERDVGQDPLSWMPTEFVDRIDGTQAINRKGFEVLRFFYGVSLDMELQVDPEDNDHTHCRYKAIAERDGERLEAWGTSHVDRGDDPWLLVELAATRARKRAISVATGAGACAVEELRSEAES